MLSKPKEEKLVCFENKKTVIENYSASPEFDVEAYVKRKEISLKADEEYKEWLINTGRNVRLFGFKDE